MNILVISQYFWPENFRVNDLVSGLVEKGHQVTVLTGLPNYPSGKFFEGYGLKGPWREEILGAEVHRVPLVPRGNGGGLRLAFNYLSFVVTGVVGVLFGLGRRRTFDAIFVFEISPVTVGIPAAVARWRFKAPILFWVLDLWPDSLIAAGAVRQSWILKVIDRLVSWIYRRSDLVLVQSRAFFPEVERHGIPKQRIRYFPNWGEPTFAKFSTTSSSVSLSGKFRILYAGNIGAAQDIPAILLAADLLKHRNDVHWHIVGDGRMADWARSEVRRLGLDEFVHFHGQHPLESMPGYFAAADLLLLALKRERIFGLTVPGKLQSYLAASKPIVAMLDGEGARAIAESGAGYACAAGDSKGLAAMIEKMTALSVDERLRMGASGRQFFEREYSREKVFKILEGCLVDVTKGEKGFL